MKAFEFFPWQTLFCIAGYILNLGFGATNWSMPLGNMYGILWSLFFLLTILISHGGSIYTEWSWFECSALVPSHMPSKEGRTSSDKAKTHRSKMQLKSGRAVGFFSQNVFASTHEVSSWDPQWEPVNKKPVYPRGLYTREVVIDRWVDPFLFL